MFRASQKNDTNPKKSEITQAANKKQLTTGEHATNVKCFLMQDTQNVSRDEQEMFLYAANTKCFVQRAFYISTRRTGDFWRNEEERCLCSEHT